MRKQSIILLMIFLGLMVRNNQLLAQSGNEPVSKVITKTFPCSVTDVFVVTGEKATIHVTGWKNNYIEARLTFSATHPDKKIAARELEYMNYSLSREKNVIELMNAFILPSSTDNIQSKLSVVMELKVPFKNELSINDKYGNAIITKMAGKIKVNIEFSDISFSDITGQIDMQTSYSEVRGNDITLSSFHSRDEESRYFLDVNGGTYTFNSKHSDLDLTVKNVLGLKVDATRTDIIIRPDRFDTYQYKLGNKDGEIYVPEEYSQQIKKEGSRNSFTLPSNLAKPLIQIATTFNTITLKKNL